VVRLRIGALSTIVPDAMRAAFPIACESTPADGAELQISCVAIAVRCEDCGGRTELDAPPIMCGFCGSVRVRVEAGDELLIESFDVEEPEV
jgi:hydrogenase nickel incorporation protein HypA/HybF